MTETPPDPPDLNKPFPPPKDAGQYGAPPPGYPPPAYGVPPYGAPAPQQSSTPLVLGIVGIVLALCCWPGGLACGIIGLVQSNAGKGTDAAKVCSIIAIALSAVSGLFSIVMLSTGNSFYYRP